MNHDIYAPQRRQRFQRGMLCMYRERLQCCREEFTAAMQAGDAESMRDLSREMESLLTASLVLITEMQDGRHHPHLTLLPRQ